MKVYQSIITIYKQRSHHAVCERLVMEKQIFIFMLYEKRDTSRMCLSRGYRASKAKTDVAAPFRLAAELLINPSPYTLANQKLIINSNKLFKVHEKGGKFSLRV